MSPTSHFLAASAAIAGVFALLFSGCASDLTSDVEGKACSPGGACLDGYSCDPASNLCVKSLPPPHDGGLDAPADAPTDGNACADAADGCAPSCAEGETRCGNDCVTLSSNPGQLRRVRGDLQSAGGGHVLLPGGACGFTCGAGRRPAAPRARTSSAIR